MIFSSLYKKITETTKKIIKATPKILFYSYIFASVATLIPEITKFCLIGATTYFVYNDCKEYFTYKKSYEESKKVNIVLVNEANIYE